MEILVPGRKPLVLKNLLCDYNGTLAKDGELLPGVAERFQVLSEQLAIAIVTADTHGTVRNKTAALPCTVHVIGHDRQDEAKRDLLNELGPEQTVAIGNGFNDRLIMKSAAVGIGLIQEEGAFVGSLVQADIVCLSIVDALDLFIYPARLIATLRN